MGLPPLVFFFSGITAWRESFYCESVFLLDRISFCNHAFYERKAIIIHQNLSSSFCCGAVYVKEEDEEDAATELGEVENFVILISTN